MGSFANHLEIGDVIKAQVAEVLDAREVIISFNGHLARAANETHRKLQVGDVVRLRVASTKPLALRVVEDERKHGRLDIIT